VYKRILVAIDPNDDSGWRAPLMAGAEQARKFGAELIVLTVLREVEAILNARAGPFAYETIKRELERLLSARVFDAQAHDLRPKLVVTHAESIYSEILGFAEGSEADLIVVGAHRPSMKDYLLGTNAGRIVRHARCSVLVARASQWR
jgi:nucleotide-binding universal stress UspA family protein